MNDIIASPWVIKPKKVGKVQSSNYSVGGAAPGNESGDCRTPSSSPAIGNVFPANPERLVDFYTTPNFADDEQELQDEPISALDDQDETPLVVFSKHVPAKKSLVRKLDTSDVEDVKLETDEDTNKKKRRKWTKEEEERFLESSLEALGGEQKDPKTFFHTLHNSFPERKLEQLRDKFKNVVQEKAYKTLFENHSLLVSKLKEKEKQMKQKEKEADTK